MKSKVVLGIAAMLAAVSAMAAEWQTDLDQALQKAKEKKHTVLLLFSGTDWCPPCKALHKNVLDSKEFNAFADKNLELVIAAFPKYAPIDPVQKRTNEMLADKYNVNGFPTTILLNKDGKVIDQMVGGAPFGIYMNFLKKNVGPGK